jgi:drug/metabolite transporter (DMT)-like permease
MEAKNIRITGAFFAIYFIWGTTFLSTRFALESIPPFLMAGSRFTLSGILLYGLSSLHNYKRPSFLVFKRALLTGILMIFFGYASLSWSQQYIASGLAALIIATISIWIALIDWLILKGTRPKKTTLVGIALGLIGLALFIKPDKSAFLNSSISPGISVISCLAPLLTALAFASGSLYIKRLDIDVSLASFISLQMIIGGIALILLGIVSGELNSFSLKEITLRSFFSLSYLILFGTLIAHSAYFWLLKVNDPVKVSTYAFFNPIIAVFVGGVLAGEIFNLKLCIGMSSILVGILLIIRPIKQKRIKEILIKFRKNGCIY